MADLENKVVEMGGKVQSVRTDLKKVEEIKRSVAEILFSETAERMPQKSRGIAL